MLKHVEISKLDDYFIDLGKRSTKGVYFYRINGYNQQIHAFIQLYYESARLNGAIIEGKLQNPDSNNLAYYNEIMGSGFQLSMGFIGASLKRWLPRMTAKQRENVAGAVYDTLLGLKKAGKNENMLKNAYIKFMCWLYYKFEGIVNHLGEEKLPKILYEGNIGNYELLLMNVLATAGCDIILLQYRGDAEYLKIDTESAMSMELKIPEQSVFPVDFSLKQIRQEIQENFERKKLYGEKLQWSNCTNAWLSGKIFEDVRKNTVLRGNKQNFYYNCFCRIAGVPDKLTYQNDLYQLQLELKNEKRKLVIANEKIEPPTMDEINRISRKSYQNLNQMIMHLTGNFCYVSNQLLRQIMNRAFAEVIIAESKKDGMNLNRLTNKAVYLLCWMKRYQQTLLGNWRMPEIGCFFYMGGCQNENEALFCRFLARLPVDVLIFIPDLHRSCCLKDDLLYEVKYGESMPVLKYPEENTGVRAGTAAYHAERELDDVLYRDTGLYRNQQYVRANSVSLQTMYEEISILWKQELRYRPNFSTVEDIVNMPVIFAKISGVKDGDVSAYWRNIRHLLTPDTMLISQVPHLTSALPNPIRAFAVEFYKNGRLQKEKIKRHKAYEYGFLRESVQDFMLNKVQLLLEQETIKGTFENGTEYTIIATALNIEKDILRMIQRFDFTKENPKVIYIITDEKMLSLEDSILVAYLNLIGFDILFFVPTGYQCVEKYFNEPLIEEHQTGEYLYDLQIPNFDTIPEKVNARPSWREFIFKRGT